MHTRIQYTYVYIDHHCITVTKNKQTTYTCIQAADQSPIYRLYMRYEYGVAVVFVRILRCT